MYKLEINDSQASILIEALDFYSRILIGQVEELEHMIRKYQIQKEDIEQCSIIERQDDIRERLNDIKKILGFQSGESFGIFNSVVHDNARIAYDIQQVIRHTQHWNLFPNGSDVFRGVSSDTPFKSSKEELPKMEILK